MSLFLSDFDETSSTLACYFPEGIRGHWSVVLLPKDSISTGKTVPVAFRMEPRNYEL